MVRLRARQRDLLGLEHRFVGQAVEGPAAQKKYLPDVYKVGQIIKVSDYKSFHMGVLLFKDDGQSKESTA